MRHICGRCPLSLHMSLRLLMQDTLSPQQLIPLLLRLGVHLLLPLVRLLPDLKAHQLPLICLLPDLRARLLLLIRLLLSLRAHLLPLVSLLPDLRAHLILPLIRLLDLSG
jgi:hypothetical protein